MVVTASALRADLYRLLDRVIETGESLVVERDGHRLRIVVDEVPSKLERMVRRPTIVGDPGDLTEISWADDWKGEPEV